jgi:flagellar protein FlgJ
MKADISTAGVYTDIQGLTRLKNASRDESPETLRAAAKQFEALFLQMMLKNMRDTSLGDGIFDSDQSKFYQEMFDKQISITMSERQGLGIAEMIVRQLSPHAIGKTIDDQNPVKESGTAGNEPGFNSPAEFVSSLRPVAEKAGKRIGVDPEVLLAQAALETGWGKAVINHPDGRSSHNLFGIKANGDWQGPRVLSSTIEYENGLANKRNETFRSYDSYEDSFSDYVEFLQANPRYQQALAQAGDSMNFIASLEQAGYATDPDYAKKINGILQQPEFTRNHDAVKAS